MYNEVEPSGHQELHIALLSCLCKAVEVLLLDWFLVTPEAEDTDHPQTEIISCLHCQSGIPVKAGMAWTGGKVGEEESYRGVVGSKKWHKSGCVAYPLPHLGACSQGSEGRNPLAPLLGNLQAH